MITLLVALLLGPVLSFAAGPIMVAVIDTGYTKHETIPLCKNGLIDFTGSGTADNSPQKHGSNVAGLIAREAGTEGYCIIMIKVFETVGGKPKFDTYAYFKALDFVGRLKPAVLNISLTGQAMLDREHDLMLKILDNGTIVVAASGNDGIDLNKTGCIIFPACVSQRIIMVANSGGRSNIGIYVDVFEDGDDQRAGGVVLSGTSQAAAIHSGKLVRRLVRAKMGH